MLLPAALLAVSAAVDGHTALRHASALAALGPHPFGSPRARAAAEYVASQLRDVGLGEVQVQEFESGGKQGANVVGVLRAPGREFLVIATHHDTLADSPGAHDADSGPGLLIELARVSTRDDSRPRTLVFASFDGGNAKGADAFVGARAYLDALGARGRDLVAALGLGGVGLAGGAPVVQAIPRVGPRAAGPYATSPAWLVRATLEGAARAEAPLPFGDRTWFSWLQQPAVRTFRVSRPSEVDGAFVKAGYPALVIDDSPASFAVRVQPPDTADKLDVDALALAGQSAQGALRALSQAARGPAVEPVWFAAFGRVFGAGVLITIGVLSVLHGLVRAFRSGGLGLAARVAQAVCFGLLLWRHPVPALWVLLLPNLLSGVGSIGLSVLGLGGALALGATGVAWWRRGVATGLWLGSWEIGLLVLALALSLVPSSPTRGKSRSSGPASRAKGLPRPAGRRARGR